MRTMFNINLTLIALLFIGCTQINKRDAISDLETTKAEKNKKDRLISAVEAYIRGIKEKDFSIIPYADSITMRTPFTKNGMRLKLKGKDVLFKDWWQPLILRPDSKDVVFKIVDYYFNESLTSIIAESVVRDYNAEPTATVYVAERFTLNEDGKINDQTNYMDVRDVLTPGWQDK
jgi:hypothetical protein